MDADAARFELVTLKAQHGQVDEVQAGHEAVPAARTRVSGLDHPGTAAATLLSLRVAADRTVVDNAGVAAGI
ncbi:hypothetical protein [Amycolatopsis panacis]|uniref:hypothetical protein n=1 Tax=Amycolatopsis panacis TaxID=2340917 RepID=UPI001F1C8BEF|nr:hypothetical protein [Amycolatopsis panacis]